MSGEYDTQSVPCSGERRTTLPQLHEALSIGCHARMCKCLIGYDMVAISRMARERRQWPQARSSLVPEWGKRLGDLSLVNPILIRGVAGHAKHVGRIAQLHYSGGRHTLLYNDDMLDLRVVSDACERLAKLGHKSLLANCMVSQSTLQIFDCLQLNGVDLRSLPVERRVLVLASLDDLAAPVLVCLPTRVPRSFRNYISFDDNFVYSNSYNNSINNK